MMIDIFKKRVFRAFLVVLLMISAFAKSAEAQQTISLSFSSGYLGTIGTSSNKADNIKKFSTLGITKVSFNQVDFNGDGKFGDAGTQGNDLAGVIKLYLSNGTVISLNGALNWRETTGSRVEVFGIIFDAGQNASIPYSGGTFSIVGGSDRNSSSNLGLKAYASTFVFTDDSDRSGNAANNMLQELNDELANSPQPSTIALTNASVNEGQNLVYTVTLTIATDANNPQVYTFSSSGTATGSSDYNSTYTFSNGVVNNGDGTITVPGGVSSFTITVATIDDAIRESTETLILNIGSKSGVGNILDNDPPTITTSGTLSAFTSCSGVASSTQTVTVSGINLTNNIIVTAPTGYEISTSGSSYSSTVTLTQSGGTVSSTTIYVRLTSAATNGASGTISVTSTGATSQTFSITAATVNALPTITLGATSSVSSSATSFSLPYSATTGNPNLYSISASTPALSGFVPVTDMALPNNTITVTIPASLANTYGFNIIVKNSTTGCVSAAVPFTQTVTGPLITVSGSLATFTTCAGVASGTQTVTVSGTNLGANIVLTAPTGYELSTDASSYSSTITLTQSGGTVNSTTIYVRLTSAATNGASGTISVTSTNASTQTFTTGTAVVNVIPTITLAATTNVSTSATSFSLPFTATSGSPNQYSITTGVTALAGFSTVTNASFNTSPITVTIPASAANTYNFNLTVKNSTTGCESAVVPFTQTITQPTITTSGALSAFTTCSGVASSTQTVTVSGTNLTNNIILTAPTGYELSTSGSSYSSTVTLTRSGGTVSSTTIYVRLTSAATNGASGTISVTSTGATSQTFATGTAIVNVIPTITLAATTNVSTIATSFSLQFTATTGSPNQYSITTGATALSGFTAVTNASLTSSPISVTIPASAANTYNFNLTVKNSLTGCESAVVPFTQTIYSASSTITVTGLTTYTYNGSAQGPNTYTSTGSTGAVTYS